MGLFLASDGNAQVLERGSLGWYALHGLKVWVNNAYLVVEGSTFVLDDLKPSVF